MTSLPHCVELWSLDWPTYPTQEPQMRCPLDAAKLPSKGVLLPSLGSQGLGLPPTRPILTGPALGGSDCLVSLQPED